MWVGGTSATVNQEEVMTKTNAGDTVATTIEMPRDLRVQLDEVRLARAHRHGGLCPPLKIVVVEALQALVAREVTP
jgi:hypothetical protein